MAYDPHRAPVLLAIHKQLADHAARLDRLDARPANIALPSVATLNRRMIGLAMPDDQMMQATASKMALIENLGVTFVRMDIRFENERDYGMAYYSAIVDTLRSKGISILAILGGDHKAATQSSREAFVRYVERAVAWLKARGVNHIQWWNEPNHGTRITEPENYAAAIRLAYPAAKAINPALFAVAAGLAGAIGQSVDGHISVVDWLRRSYAAGAQGNYDAQATHPYSYPYNLDYDVDWTGFGLTKKVFVPYMQANGEGHLKVWLTEMGFPTDGEDSHTEANQKTMYADKLADELRKYDWVGPAFHYSLIDKDATTERESRFGIYRSNGQAKPAAASLRAAIATLNSEP